jgi:hypothetical protein
MRPSETVTDDPKPRKHIRPDAEDDFNFLPTSPLARTYLPNDLPYTGTQRSLTEPATGDTAETLVGGKGVLDVWKTPTVKRKPGRPRLSADDAEKAWAYRWRKNFGEDPEERDREHYRLRIKRQNENS